MDQGRRKPMMSGPFRDAKAVSGKLLTDFFGCLSHPTRRDCINFDKKYNKSMNNASNNNKLNSKNPFKPGLAARLRQEREARGYTQIQLAEQIGINRMTQYLYERETNTPNLKYLSAIADLGLDVFYILFGSRGSAGPELRFSPPELLYEIYDVVDTIGTDAQGNLLPLESRREFFKVLCAAYSGRQAEKVDVTSIPGLIGKIPKAK